MNSRYISRYANDIVNTCHLVCEISRFLFPSEALTIYFASLNANAVEPLIIQNLIDHIQSDEMMHSYHIHLVSAQLFPLMVVSTSHIIFNKKVKNL